MKIKEAAAMPAVTKMGQMRAWLLEHPDEVFTHTELREREVPNANLAANMKDDGWRVCAEEAGGHRSLLYGCPTAIKAYTAEKARLDRESTRSRKAK